MKKQYLTSICGLLSLLLMLTAAFRYAMNAPNRQATLFTLISGAFLLIVFLVLNLSLIREFTRSRSSRYGANMLIMIVLFASILAVVQTLSMRHSRRYDLTKNSRFSLAPQTVNLLNSLKKDVSAYAFFRKSSPDRIRASDLLGLYAHETDRFRYEVVDPDRKPQMAKEMGVTNYGTVVVQCGDKKELVTELTEENLTNALLKTTRDITKVAYFVRGHGEKDIDNKEGIGYSILKEAIKDQGYMAKSLSLFEVDTIPDDAYAVVIAGPTQDYFDSEIDKLRQYLDRGRNALVMIDPLVSLPKLGGLVSEYGITFEDDIIIDPISRIFGGEYTIPVVTQYEQHPVTKGFNVATFFPVSRSVHIDEDRKGYETQYLALTGRSAWGEKNLEAYKAGRASRDEEDVPPPVPIAAVSVRKRTEGSPPSAGDSPDKGSSIIAVGDSDFANNASFRISGNGDFFVNLINYLAEEKDLIAIRPKQGLGDRVFLTASQGRLVFLLSVIVLPLSVISFGATLFVKRRRRG